MATPVPFLPLALGHLHLIVISTRPGNIQRFPAGQGLMLLRGDRGAKAQPRCSPRPVPSTEPGKQLCPRIDVLANGVPALLGVPSDLVDAGSEALKDLHEWKIVEGQDQCHFSSARSLLNCVLTKSHPGH